MIPSFSRQHLIIGLCIIGLGLVFFINWKSNEANRKYEQLVLSTARKADSLEVAARKIETQADSIKSLLEKNVILTAERTRTAGIRSRALSARTDTVLRITQDTACAVLLKDWVKEDSVKLGLLVQKDSLLQDGQRAIALYQGLAATHETRADLLQRTLDARPKQKNHRITPAVSVGYGVMRIQDGRVMAGPVVSAGLSIRLR